MYVCICIHVLHDAFDVVWVDRHAEIYIRIIYVLHWYMCLMCVKLCQIMHGTHWGEISNICSDYEKAKAYRSVFEMQKP